LPRRRNFNVARLEARPPGLLMSELPTHATLARTAEPWGYPVDPYERDHDRLIMQSLLKGSYERAFEAGCGNGELTEVLARCCRKLIATDIAPTSVARARVRCGHLNNVSIRCADLSDHLPEGPFDLVILREVGHPMNPAEMLRISLALSRSLSPAGELVALHGMAQQRTGSMAGESIHNLLSANLPLEWVRRERGVGYRLDSWVKH
jgi:SAM-dependent methyltransferase